MADRTRRYGLPTGVRADEFIDPAHHNSIADALDEVVGGIVGSLLQPGVHSGWLLTREGTVSSGCGLVGVWWCQSREASAVTGLLAGATNHVWAVHVNGEAPSAVRFVAQLAGPGPADGVYLGTVTVDNTGVCTQAESYAPGVQRTCFRLAFGSASGMVRTGVLDPEEETEIEVDHSCQAVFRVPGDLRIAAQDTGARWSVSRHHSGGSFSLRVVNEGDGRGDYGFSWVREGLLV